MNNVVDYKIMQSRDAETLEATVVEYVGKGWRPVGGPVFAEGRWHQAMVVVEPPTVSGKLKTGITGNLDLGDRDG